MVKLNVDLYPSSFPDVVTCPAQSIQHAIGASLRRCTFNLYVDMKGQRGQ